MCASPETLAGLTATRDSYFSYLLFASGAVAVGVALEGPEVIHEARKILCGIRTKARRWITLVSFVGWILVALGVLGEGISEALVSRADGNIQSFNDSRMAELTKQAGDAKKSADGAAIALKEANKQLDAVNARINEASSDLDILEGRLAWRAIRPPQYKRGKKELTPFKGSSVVIISAAPLGNPEPPEYAKQVAKVFTDSGWNVDFEPRRTRSYSPPGIECRGNSTAAGVAAEKFCESLPDVGFKSSSQIPLDAPYVEQIIIREKPSP